MILHTIKEYYEANLKNTASFKRIQHAEKQLLKRERINENRLDMIINHFSHQAKIGKMKDGVHSVPFDGFNIQVRIEDNECTDIDVLKNDYTQAGEPTYLGTVIK